MHLGFGGTRANGAPAHQIGDILRGDHIEEFPAAGRPLSLMSSSSLRAMRNPSLMRKLLSIWGSLMSPFQPTVVRGFQNRPA